MHSDKNETPAETGSSPKVWYFVVSFLVLATVGIGYLLLGQIAGLEEQVTLLTDQVERSAENAVVAAERAAAAAETSQAALTRATEAEENAADAARGRDRAEQGREEAEGEAAVARAAADAAAEDTELARAETERIRKEREQELDRLEKALGEIVETRRTALGLVMSLGSDAIEFDFNRATLRPENRELLSRIAGILLTSSGHSMYVYGHTDDVGSEAYNQTLSEQRADSVRDYLVEAGIDPAIISTEGRGKSSPRVTGTSAEARAKNRRVEIGIVDVTIDYKGEAPPPG
jgi:outer membrane protein OmpA-like peptidoglycan-associated protein